MDRALSTFRAKILEHPDDLGLRQVYADLLSERGDPRGHFIQTQCMGLEEEAAALLEANRYHLKRPLGPHATVVFRNGFIEEWTTDYLELRQGGRELFATSPMRALRVAGLKKNELAYLFEFSGLERLVELEMTDLHRSPVDALLSRPLPRLRKLVLGGRFPRAELTRLQGSTLAKQLQSLSGSAWYGDDHFEVGFTR